MANKKRVVKSINDHGASRCVDIFARPDGSFGIEEYRRDAEDNSGWFPIGRYGARVFTSQDRALREAQGKAAWLAELMKGGSGLPPATPQ